MSAYLTNSIRRGSRRPALSRLRRLLLKRLPVRKLGAVRTVFLTWRHVFKLPGRWTWSDRWYLLLRRLHSMQERDFEAEGWLELCPVSISMAGGFLFRLTEIGSSWLL